MSRRYRTEATPYVYVLSYPDGEPFYVGTGKHRRIYDEHNRNPEALKIIKNIRASGENVKRKKVFKGTLSECQQHERDLIKFHGLALTNIHGGLGQPQNKRTKQLISEAVKLRWAEGCYEGRKSPGTTGMTFKRTPEQCKRMSDAAKRRWNKNQQ